MRVLLIIRSDTQIRKDILKSRKTDCLNERCSDSIGKLREIKKKSERERGRERGQTMNRWHLRKADLCWPVRLSAASQWSRVKRGMKACEWASTGVRVPCIPWAANLPVSPLSPPTSQPCLKGCCFGCRVPTTTYRQTEWVWDLPDESTFNTNPHRALSASLPLTQCPLYELCQIKFRRNKKAENAPLPTYLESTIYRSNEAVWCIT